MFPKELSKPSGSVKYMASAPRNSMTRVNERIYNITGTSALIDFEKMKSRMSIWLYMERFPLKKMAKKLVKVRTPRAPICISTAMTVQPSGVNRPAVSTVESPVMLTALVAIEILIMTAI